MLDKSGDPCMDRTIIFGGVPIRPGQPPRRKLFSSRMARGKNKSGIKPETPVRAPEIEKAPLPVEPDPERLSALEYLVVNAVFWLFCVINLLVARWFMGEATGLYFFFGVMALGFTFACLLSYLHDRFYEDDLPESESP